MSGPYAEVIGDPIAQSKSPVIHNFWLGKLGIAAEYRACQVRAEGLAEYFAARRSDPAWQGCNITMPHKQAALNLLEIIDTQASRIGAVNTVSRRIDGALSGSNTDAPGFLEPLRAIATASGRVQPGRALVIGAGGAARAIISALGQVGYQVEILNRDLAKAMALAEEFGAPITGVARLDRAGAAPALVADPQIGPALLINTTALGMAGHPPLQIRLDRLGPGVIVYDIVTSPAETPLLREAKRCGLPTIDGLAMLIGQAAVAFERFFGQAAPREHDLQLRALLI